MYKMLPKLVYSKVMQDLKRIRKNWDEDRAENPTRVPYEIDSELRYSIENAMREGGMRRDPEAVQDTIEYLIGKKIVVGSPYGGIMFPLPEDAPPLPTRKDLIEQTKERLKNLGF